MTNNQAKDFIIGQVTEQAVREGASLSALELRIMYLSDGDPDSERLTREFDAQPCATISEAKISILLHHAYERLKKDNRDYCWAWEDAVLTLQDGDHYLFKFWVLVPLHEIGRPSRTRRFKQLWARLTRDGWGSFVRKQGNRRLAQVEASDTPGSVLLPMLRPPF